MGICTARCTSEGLGQYRMREPFLTTPTITEHGTVKKIYACNIFQVFQLEHFKGVEPINHLRESVHKHACRLLRILFWYTGISTHTHTHMANHNIPLCVRAVGFRTYRHRLTHTQRQRNLNDPERKLEIWIKPLVFGLCYC